MVKSLPSKINNIERIMEMKGVIPLTWLKEHFEKVLVNSWKEIFMSFNPMEICFDLTLENRNNFQTRNTLCNVAKNQ